MRREHRPWPQPSLSRFPSGQDDKRSGRLISVEEVSPRVSVVRTHWTAVVATGVEEGWKSVMADDWGSAPDRGHPQVGNVAVVRHPTSIGRRQVVQSIACRWR